MEKKKTIIKSAVIEIAKQKFRQHKRPISIKRIDFNKRVASFGKKGFKYFIGYKDAKKLDLYIFISKRSAHIEETLKLNICLFS